MSEVKWKAPAPAQPGVGSEATLADSPAPPPDLEEPTLGGPQPQDRPAEGPPKGRLSVLKTYKVYLGGQFVRSESGRTYAALGPSDETLANVCRCSRKDLRDAMLVARSAQPGWAARSAYNRGQILYRMAEMLEGRKSQFVHELIRQGAAPERSEAECLLAIDRIVYYAGWADKFQQVFSSVNPVSSSHFNFSVPEPMGTVAVLAPEESPLLGLVSVVTPVIVGGNTCVVMASQSKPLCAVTLAEVLHAADLPHGVVNLLTGERRELLVPFSSHMDTNAIVSCVKDPDEMKAIDGQAADNVKRVVHHAGRDWWKDDAEGPYRILDTQEIKTTWHPVGS